MSEAELSHWKARGAIGAKKWWTGHPEKGAEFKILGRIMKWVDNGQGPTGHNYDVIISVTGTLSEFYQAVERGVYENPTPISMDRIVEYYRRDGN